MRRTYIQLNPQNTPFNIYTGLTMTTANTLVAEGIIDFFDFICDPDQDHYYLKFSSEVAKDVFVKVNLNPSTCPTAPPTPPCYCVKIDYSEVGGPQNRTGTYLDCFGVEDTWEIAPEALGALFTKVCTLDIDSVTIPNVGTFGTPIISNEGTCYSEAVAGPDENEDGVPDVYLDIFNCRETLCVGIFGDNTIVNLIYQVMGSHNGKTYYTNTSAPPSVQKIYWSLSNNRWEISENLDGAPTSYLEYSGNEPLSGHLPNNEQWNSTIAYSTFGAIDSTITFEHGPCYLPVCFTFTDQANIGSCVSEVAGIYNNKPYYILNSPTNSCSVMNVDGNEAYVWWDETNSRWVLTIGIFPDLTGVYLVLTPSDDDVYPSGYWTELSTPPSNNPIIFRSTIFGGTEQTPQCPEPIQP